MLLLWLFCPVLTAIATGGVAFSILFSESCTLNGYNEHAKRFRYMLMNRQIVLWDQLHLKGQTVDFWWLGGSVTLVAVFSFLLKKFGRWQGPTIGTLSFYDCRLSGGDTQSTCCNQRNLNFCTYRHLHLHVKHYIHSGKKLK